MVAFAGKLFASNDEIKDEIEANNLPANASNVSLLVEQQPTYINDSNHAINIFSTFLFQGEHCLLFSMDVKLLYTSIPHEDGLIALRNFLDQ